MTEANVSAQVQLERLGGKDGTQAIRVSFSIENSGPAPARILGSTLLARGWRVLPLLAHPLRKECYALITQEDGSISASVRTTAAGTCRLSTTTASATIALR